MTAAASTTGSARFSMTALLASCSIVQQRRPMRLMRRWFLAGAAAAAACAWLSGAPTLGAASAGRVSLDELLDKVGWYLDYFVDEFENVVAEETYIQDSAQALPSFSPMSGGGRGGLFV